MTADDLMRDYSVYVRRYEPTDPRLGRIVVHDSRSRLFAAPAVDTSTLTSIRHTSHVPVLDQGNVGACVGVSATKCLSYGPFWDGAVPASGTPDGAATVTWARDVLSETDADADSQYGIGVYSDCTKVDPFEGTYPPDDSGSNGMSAGKVLKTRGLISGYVHALSLDAALGLVARQAVITGIPWTNDMFEPTSAGELKPTGGTAGGHEIVVDEIDVERKRAWVQNQWTESWGIGGRAWLSWDAWGTLLADDGDVTGFVPNSVAAPVPTPTPVVAHDAFVKVGDQWAYRERHSSASNIRMVKAYKAWKDAGAPGG